MKRPLASSPAEWLNEIKLAIEDAKEAKPFGRILGVPITHFDLFQLAPLAEGKRDVTDIDRLGGHRTSETGT